MKRLMLITLAAAALTGCAGQFAGRQVDAADVTTRSGEPVEMRFAGWDLTARDWNCKGCYK